MRIRHGDEKRIYLTYFHRTDCCCTLLDVRRLLPELLLLLLFEPLTDHNAFRVSTRKDAKR